MNDIELILQVVGDNLENPQWLSEAVVKLAAALYYHNSQMAAAELKEKQVMVSSFDLTHNGKPYSVEKVKALAVKETGNNYGKLKAQGEALIETINAIKSRLRVLGWERGGNKEV